MSKARATPNDDSYFIGRLILESVVCRDPEIQKTAIIADKDNVYIGYNQLIKEYSTLANNWNDRNFALLTAEHAALDKALRNKSSTSSTSTYTDLIGCTMYINNPPTWEGLVRCASVGLKKIIYIITSEKNIDTPNWEKAQYFAKDRKLDLKQFDGNLNWIRDRIQKYDYLF